VQTLLVSAVKTLSDSIWDRAELETNEGIRCNTGHARCSLGTRGLMSLGRISDADHVLLDRVLREVVVKQWAQRCGAECTGKWNDTVGNVVNIQGEP
jgi:hypothetical protein